MTERELEVWKPLIESTAKKLSAKFGRRLPYADALQHTLVAAFNIDLDPNRSKASCGCYLKYILFFRSLDEALKDFSNTSNIDADSLQCAVDPNSQDTFLDFETLLDRAILDFQPNKRASARLVTSLVLLEGYSTAEAAKAIEVSQRTVQRTIQRVKQFFASTKAF